MKNGHANSEHDISVTVKTRGACKQAHLLRLEGVKQSAGCCASVVVAAKRGRAASVASTLVSARLEALTPSATLCVHAKWRVYDEKIPLDHPNSPLAAVQLRN
jgi:tRNA-dihydrouridine synthase